MFMDLITLWLFILATLATPGPGNLLTMQFGVVLGVRKAMMFVLGTTTTYSLVSFVVGAGLPLFFEDHGAYLPIMKFVSAAVMLALLAQGYWASQSNPTGDMPRFRLTPAMLLIQGLMVPPLNPKAWAILVLCWAEFGTLYDTAWKNQLFITGNMLIANVVIQFHYASLGSYLGKKAAFGPKVQLGMTVATALAIIILVLM